MSSTPADRSRIFINYRRQDSEHVVGRLADDLRRVFSRQQVFQDIASIDPGADFQDTLRQGLDSCAAVLVVIGPDWLHAQDARGRRRLDLEDDWVCHEIAEGLKSRDVRVFPVLVDNTAMPASDELPESVRALTRRQAFPLTTRHWAKDIDELVGHLRRVPGLGQASAAPQAPAPQQSQPPAPVRDAPRAPDARVSDNPRAPAATAAPDKPVGEKEATPSRPFPWKVGIGIAGAALAGVLIYRGVPERQDPPPPSPAPPAKEVSPPPASIQSAKPTEAAFKAGAAFRDCDGCPEMVVVPAGSFMMGSRSDEKERDSDEGPQHRVTIARPFAVGKYEITFDEWDACVAAGGCRHKPGDNGWGRGRQPVTNVSWDDAQAYVKWLSSRTGNAYRLLSEAEWEYAARAGSTTRYPWGDEPGNNQANFDGSGSRWSGKQTAPVGSFGPNAFGLHDMIGNAWEWTQDCWNKSYDGAPPDGRAWGTNNCGLRVVRGGSWFDNPRLARAALRDGLEPVYRSNVLGFRLARTL